MDGSLSLQPTLKARTQGPETREIRWLCYRWAPSEIHGWGVFARVPIAKGARIGEYKGAETEDNDTYVLWVEDGDDLIARNGENGLRFLNHSHSPNAVFDGFELFALRDIEVDEEITFDYGEDTEDFS